MNDLIQKFFDAHMTAFSNTTVFTKDSPEEMMLTQKKQNGWFEWNLIKGTITEKSYGEIENEFEVKFPKSFIQWHKEYFFLNADTSILRLPISNPNLPLKEIRQNLDWFIAEQIIPEKLYPFGAEGNDAGSLVFDGRLEIKENDFPIRYYDHEFGGDLEGLSEIIFSSFEKLLECTTHFMLELKKRKNFEIIPDFFNIDPNGAGMTGVDYWNSWINMQKANCDDI
jgi:hypothetical protein